MGRASVASVPGLRFFGFPVWLVSHLACMASLPGLERNLRVVMDWMLDIPFRKHIAVLAPERTERLRRAWMESIESKRPPGESSGLSLRHQLHARPRPDVVPGALVGVQQHPPKSQAEGQPRHQGGDKAQQSAAPTEVPAVAVDHPQTPGAHAQGLAAVGPEPAEKQERHGQQVGLVEQVQERLLAGDRFAVVECQGDQGSNEQQGQEQKAVVDNGGQAPHQARSGKGGRGVGGGGHKASGVELRGNRAMILPFVSAFTSPFVSVRGRGGGIRDPEIRECALMSIVSDLAARQGVLAAGEFSQRGDGFSYAGLLEEEQARMAAVMCRANTLVVSMQASMLGAFDRRSERLAPRGWIVRGGCFSVCVMANVFCFVENGTGCLSDIVGFMRRRIPELRQERS
jgi:roadblock/LC7 domain-containing protein